MQDKPLISAIVPARNEEGVIAACAESLARQPEIGEILVVNDHDLPAAAANGQYLMIRRDAYDPIGGHGGVAGEILEDVALARRAKAPVFGLRFSSGQGSVPGRRDRAFRTKREVWRNNVF